jgi:SSS family solute:Na+ symporter
MTLNTLDLIILVGSLLIVLFVGWWSGRKAKESANNYFLGSGKLPWWMIGAAFVATSVSSEQIVGTVGRAYQDGMKITNMEWFMLPIYTLLLLFFIPLYLKNRITTVPAFLRHRFSPLIADIYSWVMTFGYIFVFLVPVLYGSSKTFSELTGWNYYVVLWITIIIVGSYTLEGGIMSVMWTDVVQCAMLLGGGVLLFFVCLNQIPGGWSAMMQANPQRYHLYAPPDDPIMPFLGRIFMTFGISLFYSATNQVMVQRVLGARSIRDGFLGIIFSGFINFFRPLVTVFLGFIVYHWIFEMKRAEPLANPDLAFPFALEHLAPSWGLRGVVLAGFVAAVMSTVSSLVNSINTMFALDIYKKRIAPEADDKKLIRVGQIFGFGALIVAGLLSPQIEKFGGIFVYFQTSLTYLATPLVSVFLMGMFWRRTNWQGALFGIVGGLIIQIAVAVGLPAMGIKWHWSYNGAIAQVLVMVGIAIVSLQFPAPAKEAWKPFKWTPNLLRNLDFGKNLPWYKTLRFWFAVYASIWFFLYWRFW